IEQGGPADVFASADIDWMDYGSDKKVVKDETRINLLSNQLVLIAPKDSKLGNVMIGPGFNLAQLVGDGRIATADVRVVPVGKYAKAALEKLGSWDAAASKFAMTENVRAALMLVARGEAPLQPMPRSSPALRSLARSLRSPIPRSFIPSLRPRLQNPRHPAI